MCFGPVAGFTVATTLTAAAAGTLAQVRTRKEFFFALIPAAFAVQQMIESVLWLSIRTGRWPEFRQPLAFAFILFAHVLWPAYSPFSAYMLEPEPKRRRLMRPLIYIGVAIAVYMIYYMLRDSVQVTPVQHSLKYGTTEPRPAILLAFYLGAVFVPYLLSSYKAVVWLGVLNVIFCGLSYALYSRSFDSVWCFFAAILSAGIFFFLRRLRSDRAR